MGAYEVELSTAVLSTYGNSIGRANERQQSDLLEVAEVEGHVVR